MESLAYEERTLTELDHARLSRLLHARRAPGAGPAPEDMPGGLLDAATIVPSREVSPDVVTMYSQVIVRDCETGEPRKLTVCYPADAEPASGFVSVLSPVGASLIGQRVGAVARWQTPDGEAHRAEIEAVLFQPEATGDFTT
jgi:regulator of nucleoside diphosphate kinase